MADINRALEDIAFLSKRFAGLIDLGNDIKAVQVLMDQKASMTKMVEDLTKESADLKAKISKSKSDLKKVEEALWTQDMEMEKAAKAFQVFLSDLQKSKDKSVADHDKHMAEAQAEAAAIVAAAREQAQEVKKASDAEVVKANDKLATLNAEIARLKSRF